MSFEASSSSSIQPSVQTTIDVECSRSSKRRRANFDAEVAYYESNTLDLAEEEIVEEVEEDQQTGQQDQHLTIAEEESTGFFREYVKLPCIRGVPTYTLAGAQRLFGPLRLHDDQTDYIPMARPEAEMAADDCVDKVVKDKVITSGTVLQVSLHLFRKFTRIFVDNMGLYYAEFVYFTNNFDCLRYFDAVPEDVKMLGREQITLGVGELLCMERRLVMPLWRSQAFAGKEVMLLKSKASMTAVLAACPALEHMCYFESDKKLVFDNRWPNSPIGITVPVEPAGQQDFGKESASGHVHEESAAVGHGQLFESKESDDAVSK